ncbi:MAG: replication factor C small subunit [Halobacteriota archaeon]|nr:replication factor C small subunit [Halobacteriota archaeon]
MEEIWVEKYRPKKLCDVVGQEEATRRLQAYVDAKTIPHLLFSGPPGVGKTACAISATRELFGDSWQMNFTELNASDERGIDTVRYNIKSFAKTAPLGGADFKVIFLDEADALTSPAQSALRRTMEQYSRTCRFILSCNYSSKIIEPIQSRCAIYRFRPLSKGALKERILYVASEEDVNITDDAVDAIIYIAMGDMRRAINSLQSAAVLKKKIDSETIYQVTATAHPEEMEELIELALAGDLVKSLKKLEYFFEDQGLSGGDITEQIYRAVLGMDIPAQKKVKLIDRIGETDFRITEGANERVQLDALIAHFVLSRSE